MNYYEVRVWASKQVTGDPITKAILRTLAEYADSKMSCFPGQQTIADEVEVNVRTVQRHLKKLESGGWITRHRRFNDKGNRTSDRYFLNCESLGDNLSGDAKSDDPYTTPGVALHDTGCDPYTTPVSGEHLEELPEEHIKKTKPRKSALVSFPNSFDFDAVREWTVAFSTKNDCIITSDDFEQFKSHHLSKDTRFANWEQAWQTWARNAKKFSRPQAPSYNGGGADWNPMIYGVMS